MTSDDPLANLQELESLHNWGAVILLVVGNLFGLPAVIYAYRIHCFFMSVCILFSIIYSMLYHLCQTAHLCFFVPYVQWVIADHISAPFLAGILLLFVVNYRSRSQLTQHSAVSLQVLRSLPEKPSVAVIGTKPVAEPSPMKEPKKNLGKSSPFRVDSSSGLVLRTRMPGKTKKTKQRNFESTEEEEEDTGTVFIPSQEGVQRRHIAVNGKEDGRIPMNQFTDEQSVVSVAQSHQGDDTKYYYNQVAHREENMIYDAWTAFTTMTLFFITVLSALAHPFSSQAFIIVIFFAILVLVFKISLIDEGYPVNMADRVSLPELLISLILAVIGLICFVADSFVAYEALHTLWHIFIYLFMFFFLVGLSANSPYHYSLWKPCRSRVMHHCTGSDLDDDYECVEDFSSASLVWSSPKLNTV